MRFKNQTYTLLFLLQWLLLLVSCHKSDTSDPVPPDGADRTVLVYMAAQNSLGGANYHRKDSLEIMNGCKDIPMGGRLLMFIDDQQAPRLYEVMCHMDHPRLVRTWDKDVCSTDPAVLTDVLTYVRQNFVSREYGLVMWSHADGWIPPTDRNYPSPQSVPSLLSFGIDAGTNGKWSDVGPQMDVADMAHAIADAGVHCKFIFFDACLMQNLEVDYALRHVTDYVVASPMATPGNGSYYTHDIQSGFFSEDPSDLARTYLQDVQSPALSADYSDFGLSISCIRTAGLDALAQTLSEVLPHSNVMNRTSADLRGVLHYQAYTRRYAFRPHNYDARQALRAILSAEDFARVSALLDEVVVYHGSSPTFWIGPGNFDYQHVPVSTDDYRSVSLFIPQDVYTTNASATTHGDLNEAFRQTEWYRNAGWAQTGW